MKFESVSDITRWLNGFEHPWLPEAWAEVKGVVNVKATGEIHIQIPFAAASLLGQLTQWVELQRQNGVAKNVSFTFSCRVATLKAGEKTQLKGVKNIIAVSSAKGGVGKSTTSVNLALALKAQGAKVGMLDADIYGPSVPMMLGAMDKSPASRDGKLMEPVEAHGIFTNSIGYLVDAQDATIWRGPMASKALAQLMNETRWPDLDYLVIDMPPGTGDIQLTLAQQIPVTGVVVVTTPQDLALADAVKGVNMFAKVEVPVAGVIENMSFHTCSNCGHHEAIFGSGGAEEMAKEYGVPLLAQLPLHINIRADIDNGIPTVVARPNAEQAKAYLSLAGNVASRLYWQGDVMPDQIMFTAL